MGYYKVLVGSAQYHGNEALTYSSSAPLKAGALVRVPLQRFSALGIVTEAVTEKPSFATKPILELFDLPALPTELPRLVEWLRAYYPAPLGQTTLSILPGQLTAKTIDATAGLTAPVPIMAEDLPSLTAEQTTSLERIDKPDTYLLHGDTGTGKTRVYIELARRAIEAGKSAIILTPEISLTSQLAQNFQKVFGERVVIMHSSLTPKSRQQVWLKVLRSTEPLIVLGPRSTLFAPVRSVGLIVVDEFHEPAYKQEQAPHYQAVRVASQLAKMHSSVLVLGSATPLITDYYIAERLKKPILRMRTPAREQTHDDATVDMQLVDLKDRNNFSRSHYLSDALINSIKQSLSNGEQSLLYLNRRGTARVILCTQCGWQATCPHCDLPMTYHHDVHMLQCHTCGFHQKVPTSCPDCGNTEIVFKVVGTKAIEEEVRKLFAGASVMRFDTDNTAAERFEKHYDDVRDGKIDILVGTQLLAKGLDLPKLTTLGVVIADTSLTFPDYSAEERTYQLLNQVIGRVGRGHSAHERIIVQSYDPERAVIRAALSSDWDSFYKAELAERELFNFPPLCYVLKLACRMASSKAAETKSEQFLYSARRLGLPLLFEGPTPSFHTKIAGKFEWQILVKSKDRNALLQVVKVLPKSGWSYDIDPINLL